MRVLLEPRQAVGEQRIKIEPERIARQQGETAFIEWHRVIFEVRVEPLAELDLAVPFLTSGVAPELQAIDYPGVGDNGALHAGLAIGPLHGEVAARYAKR